MKRFDKWMLLPHACIVLALMLLTFLIIDRFNSAMNFIDNDLTKAVMLALCLLSLVCCLLLVSEWREQKRRRLKAKRREEAQRRSVDGM